MTLEQNVAYIYGLLKNTFEDWDFKEHLKRLVPNLEGVEKAIEKSEKWLFSDEVEYPDQSSQNAFGKSFYHPSPLGIDNSLGGKSDEKIDPKYVEGVKQKVVQLLESLTVENAEAVGISLSYIIERYFWCITAFEIAEKAPKIPWAEFAKIRAMYASILLEEEVKQDDSPFLLVCLDLSGIQSFIYNIHSTKAANSLKGRSLYLQLLNDSLLRRIGNATRIHEGFTVYSSGGKSFMLLPNTDKNQEALIRERNAIEKNLFEQHKLEIFACLDFIPFGIRLNDSGGQFVSCEEKKQDGKLVQDVSGLFETLIYKTSLRKKVRYEALLSSKKGFDSIFKVKASQHGDDIKTCAVTGERFKARDESKYILNYVRGMEDEDKVYVRPIVKKMVNLGKLIKKANYLVLYHEPGGERMRILDSEFYYSFESKLPTDATSSQKAHAIYYLNPLESSNTLLPEIPSSTIQGHLFIGGIRQAEVITETDEDSKNILATYEALAQPDEGYSFNKLGIMRMDVDDLGVGLTKFVGEGGYNNFMMYAHLSKRLDFFFTGYLNHFWESGGEQNKVSYKERVNVLYAGGDDLFIVGRWKEVLDFAHSLRKKYQEYTQGELMLSGGIISTTPKFPIAKAAEQSAEVLDRAKEFEKSGKPKNALGIFSEAYRWEDQSGKKDEWEFLWELSRAFIKIFTEEDSINRAFLQKIFDARRSLELGEKDWHWQLPYDLQRYKQTLVQQYKKQHGKETVEQSKAIRLVENVKKAVFDGNFQEVPEEVAEYNDSSSPQDMLKLIATAAQIADYEIR